MEKRKHIFPAVLRRQVILILVSQMESSSEGLGLHKWTDSFDIKALNMKDHFSHQHPHVAENFHPSILIWGKDTNDKNYFNRIKILKHKPENQQRKKT